MVQKRKKSSRSSHSSAPIDCVHFNASINLSHFRKSLIPSRFCVCIICEKNHVRDSRTTECFTCLQCGAMVCRRGDTDHVSVHGRTPRSTSHFLFVDLHDYSILCIDCEKYIDVQQSKKVTQCISQLQKLATDSRILPPVSMPSQENHAVTIIKSKEPLLNGLKNLGNTCFFNSVMQNVFKIPQLRLFLNAYCPSINLHITPDLITKYVSHVDEKNREHLVPVTLELNPAGPLTSSLKTLLNKVALSEGVISPKELFTQICTKNSMFKSFDQQDAHEFFIFFLSALNDESDERIKNAILQHFSLDRNSKKSIVNPVHRFQIKGYWQLLKAFKSIYDRMLGGTLVKFFHCLSCDHVFRVTESFLNISLSIEEERVRSQRHRVAKTKFKPSLKTTGKYSTKVRKPVSTVNSFFNCYSSTDEDCNGLSCSGNSSLHNGNASDEFLQVPIQNFKYNQAPRNQSPEPPICGQAHVAIDKDEEYIEKTNPFIVSDNSSLGGSLCPLFDDLNLTPLSGIKYQNSDNDLQNLRMPVDINTATLSDGINLLVDVEDKLSIACNYGSSALAANEHSKSASNLSNLGIGSPPSSLECKRIYSRRHSSGCDGFPNGYQSDSCLPNDTLSNNVLSPSSPILSNSDSAKDFESEEDYCITHYPEELKTLSNSYKPKPKELSVMSLLYKFTRQELLCGSNGIICEKCNNEKENDTRTASTWYRFQSIPSTLVLHFKRFSQAEFRLRKLETHFDIPIVIDLAPFFIPIDEESSGRLLYSLFGVVEHLGSMNRGHYIAYVRSCAALSENTLIQEWLDLIQPQSSNLDILNQNITSSNDESQWYYISDSRVEPCDLKRVISAKAYLLFYQKIQEN